MDIGIDHDPVLLIRKVNLKRKFQIAHARIKFGHEILKDTKINEIFQAQLEGRFVALNLLDRDINVITNEVVLEAEEEALCCQKKQHQPWMSNDILDLCDKRRTFKKTNNSSAESSEEYYEDNNLVGKQTRVATEFWINQQCENIKKGMTKANSKQTYDTL